MDTIDLGIRREGLVVSVSPRDIETFMAEAEQRGLTVDGGRMRKFEATQAQRDQVRMSNATGTTNELIADIIGISRPTLTRAFEHELETGLAEANAKVAESLYEQAISGNVTAQIFWLKTRAGWRETNRCTISRY